MKLQPKYAQIIFVTGWLLILVSLLSFGWESTWRTLAVPTISPVFADMRTVQGSLLSISEGFNPQVNNPGDPWQRAMNYPSIWSLIANIANLQYEANYIIFVAGMIISFLFSCFLLVRQYPSITLLLLCFSGATLLAVERGNNDIVIFSLLYFAAVGPSVFYFFAIFIATLLKIYPVLAIPGVFRSFKSLVVITILLAIALASLWSEFSVIREATPGSAVLSYGSQSVLAAAQRFNISFPPIVFSALLLFASLVILSIQKLRDRLVFREATSREKQLFLLGSCIYIGTFIIASNWDYRLIFLLFCVPMLMRLQDRFIRFGVALLLLCAMNHLPLHVLMGTYATIVNILSKIVLFVTLATITLTQLRETFSRVFKFALSK